VSGETSNFATTSQKIVYGAYGPLPWRVPMLSSMLNMQRVKRISVLFPKSCIFPTDARMDRTDIHAKRK